MRNKKYSMKTLVSALLGAEDYELEESAYAFASALTGLSREELEEKVKNKDICPDLGCCFDKYGVLKLLIDRGEDVDEDELRFAASLLLVSKDRMQALLNEYREEHEERHIELSIECSFMRAFTLTVTNKELKQLENGDGKLFKKLYSQTVREAVRSRAFDMDYAIYDEDREEDIVGWRR